MEGCKQGVFSRPLGCSASPVEHYQCAELYRGDGVKIGAIHYAALENHWTGTCYGPEGKRKPDCNQFRHLVRQEVVNAVIQCAQSHEHEEGASLAVIGECPRCRKPFGEVVDEMPVLWRGLVLCRGCLRAIRETPKTEPLKEYEAARCSECNTRVDDGDIVLAYDADTMYCDRCVFDAFVKLHPRTKVAMYHKPYTTSPGELRDIGDV